jgi:hypothetical protein
MLCLVLAQLAGELGRFCEGAPVWRILGVVCAEMRGCATHAACLILLLLSNDSSMN